MIALFRILLILLVFLTVVYITVSLYSRAVRREKLERQWEEEGAVGDKRAYVKAGLAEYDGSLRRKLIWGVYVVPLGVIGTIIYIVNYS